MSLTRQEIVGGLLSEYDDFAALLRSLDQEQWTAPTRCNGWEVRDVAGHVVGLAAEIATGTPSGQSADEQAAARRDRSIDEVCSEFDDALEGVRRLADAIPDSVWDAPGPLRGFTVGEGVLVVVHDAYVHGDDIRAALSLPPVLGDRLRIALEAEAVLLTGRGWGPATLQLTGMPAIAVGEGRGRRIEGDPHTFVLVATGREDPAVLGLDSSVNIYA